LLLTVASQTPRPKYPGHVLQQVEPSFEGAALDQVESEVGIRVVDPILAGGTGDHREDDDLEAIHQLGRNQRSTQAHTA
jgi:hypothetical protein